MGRLSSIAIPLFLLAMTGQQDRPVDYPLRSVPLTDVRIGGRFWRVREVANRHVTLPHAFERCEGTGRIDNFAVAGGLQEGEFRGARYNDSDVYKVIQGAATLLGTRADLKWERYLDGVIAKIAAAQEEDGYLYTAGTIASGGDSRGAAGSRWSSLSGSHELYCAGHLYEAAVAHHRATGKRTLLEVAIKNADLVAETFGPEGKRDVPGHQEIEIGLVKLFSVTGKKEYLDLARFFLEERGRPGGRGLYGSYCQDHLPVAEQTEAVGHSVRALYMYSGMADVAALTGDEKYIAALERLWEDVVSRKMYITGGVGANPAGEAFGEPYNLPNGSAYNETCAAIAHALWNHRMFLLHGDGKYIDVLERVIYNGVLTGISLEGDRFFYPNPLACTGKVKFNHGTLGRAPWFGCACCPTNIVRFIPSIKGLLYAVRDRRIYVNLYASGSARIRFGDDAVRLSQETLYPWEGKVRIQVEPEGEGEFAIALRIPGWVRGKPVPSDLYRYLDPKSEAPDVTVNGEKVEPVVEKGFAIIEREWSRGDTVELNLPMPIRRVVAHEEVKGDRGLVALERGPIVYCFEGVDHAGRVNDLFLPDDAKLTPEHRKELLGGVTVLLGKAHRAERGKEGSVDGSSAELVAVPYHLWAHREVGEMAVWIPRTLGRVKLPPPPTLASTSEASASHVWVSDTISALNDQVDPKSSGDHSIPRHTWWDHKGTVEWVQYDLPAPTEVSSVEVYWFDDTGVGGCRCPETWRLFYREWSAWKEVQGAGPYGVEKDRFNHVSFDPVRTSRLRLEVKLQPGFSGGLLEWRIN